MHGLVEVAYGTTTLDIGKHPLDLTIQNAEDLGEIGLLSATRFALSRTVPLFWCKEFFSPHPNYTEVLVGKLNARQKIKLQTLIQKRKRLAREAGKK